MPQNPKRPAGANGAAAVKVFPPIIALAAVLLGLLLEYLRPIDTGFELSRSARYWTGGVILGVAILGLGIGAVTVFRLAGESPFPWRPTLRLVHAGPYRFTRNPMYLELVLSCAGLAVLLRNVWIGLLTPVCAWLLQRWAILPEEHYLENKFGADYLAYKRRVRRWL